MGQGYSSIALPAGPSAIETAELTDLTFERPLGGARFLRTVRARHQNGVVVAKVAMKSSSAVSFKQYARLLRQERQNLRDIPNVLPYSRIRETATLGVLVRQFIHTSLYDRISIRPFLEHVEKKWIAFQLLCAVRDCHGRGVFHGDIKSENVMVTSWGWVYLTDFASSFKPVYLPQDNPADFSFYYDSSARRTCYLAPERFLAAGEQPSEGNVVQWNMDIFSLGCVLAELFTEVPTFTLPQLFRYRKGEYDPTVSLLNKVDDDHVRNLISSMIRLDPTERWHASDYLDEYKGKAFPLYFYNHLHTLMQEITDPASGRRSVVASELNNGYADDRIDRVYNDYEMLSVSLGYEDAQRHTSDVATPPPYSRGLFPLQIDLPNSRHAAHAAHLANGENGTFILLNVITASLRSSARSSTKVRACELLLAFAERVPDEAKLDRILPYIMPLLDDRNEMVLIAALRTMTQILALVTVVAPVNSFLFTQYIFPRLQQFVKGEPFERYPLVRATYAACLASLAETASRFLDIMQALRAEGSLPSADKITEADADNAIASDDAFDEARLGMLEQFEAQTKVFLTDGDKTVRRAFLSSVSSLCVFLGESRAADVILSHLNTYLNDPDWMLKCSFIKTIVGVAIYVGSANLEEFILPLMLQALTDPQEFVVEQVLRSLATMAELGMLQRAKTWELIDTVARFEMHPNLWIKEAAAHFISATTTYLSMADVRILVAPLIEPYLKVPVSTLDESELLDALKKPLPRIVLDLAIQWASRVEKSSFWKTAKESHQLTYSSNGNMPPHSSVAGLGPKALARAPKTDEDDQWLGRLRNAGMHTEDEMKLLAFREYIWRAARRTKRDQGQEDFSRYEEILSLSRLKVTPQTVIFDNDVNAYEQHIDKQNRTIAEAIEEASNSAAKATKSNGEHEEISSAVDEQQSSEPSAVQQPRRLSGLRAKGSGSLSSSPSSGIGLLGRDVDQALRQRGAAPGLMTGVDIKSKAQAAVATDDTTATGRLNLPRTVSRHESPAPNSSSQRRGIERATSQRAVHNYVGNDPTVLKLLDAVYVDNFPVDAVDFGPLVQPCTGAILSNASQATAGPWRPQGQLLGILGEHTAAVTRIVASPDHLFFLTASNDGTVKIWDSGRLERNVTHRARQTYRLGEGVRVTSLCFVEATHTFVCTGSDGSVHAVRVDVAEANGVTRYGKLRVVRDWQIPTTDPSGEFAVWSEHFRGDSASTFVMATNLGRILALDLRHMTLLWDLHNPAHHGTPTCFCMSRRHDWLLVGTSHGVLDLWDIRFRLRLRSWTFINAAPISRVQLAPGRKTSKRNRFCITGGTAPGEISIWDAEKAVCYEVYRPAHAHSKERLHARDYELKNMEDERAEASLTRIANIESTKDSNLPKLSSCSFFGAQPSSKDPDANHMFALTGGPDTKVRFWDCERLDGCRLVSGGAAASEKFAYTISQLSQDTKVVSEKPSTEESGTAGVVESNKVTPNAKRQGSNAAKAPTSSRYETIRLQGQNLLREHLDTVLDVALLERPFGMVLSADRSGQVFVHL